MKNDSEYPQTFYNHTAINGQNYPVLKGNVEADVCIIGGGLAGLSCAHELQKSGKKVIILEAKRIAWGASGRNGGIVFPGFARGQNYMEQKLGLKAAQEIFSLSLEGVEMVRDNIESHKFKHVSKTDGILSVIRYDDATTVKRHCQEMSQKYNYDLDYIDRDAIDEYAQTKSYYQASLDRKAFHFHPLNYCLNLANLLQENDVQIFEKSETINMQLDGALKTITTKSGSVKAQHVVLCGGGYSGKAYGKIQKSILPIATYIITTEKLGSQLHDLIPTKAAIIDDRMASDYYRIVDGDRLLWGGRITAKTSEPKTLGKMIKADMLNVYPSLKHVKIDFAWTGLMAYARHRMPYIGALSDGVWVCTAFGGHGMNTAPIGGRLVAEAITKQTSRIDIFKHFPLQWNGGVFGPVATQATYMGMKTADWWRESRSK